MLQKYNALVTLLVAFIVQGHVHIGCACDTIWNLPKDRFDGVNEVGTVSFWRQIGVFDFDESVKIPLVIGFQSDRDSSSPYLGSGWILPILESNIVQDSENTFTLVQPDGWTRRFNRAKASDTLLRGGGGWAAEINGDTITAWAECGWRLVYEKGKIKSIASPKGKVLYYEYKDNRVSAIRDGLSTLLAAEIDPSGKKADISVNGKRYNIQLEDRPIISQISGRKFISSLQSALQSITNPFGVQETFDYTPHSQLEPALTFSKSGVNRTIIWDPQSRLIKQDNEWKYEIARISSNSPRVAIERKDSKGEEQYWKLDIESGTEITKAAGIERIQKWFMSGTLKDKIRNITEIIKGQEYGILSLQYDEMGKLIRKTSFDDEQFNFASGLLQNLSRKGESIWNLQKEQTGNQVIVRYLSKDGQTIEWCYENQQEEKISKHLIFKKGTKIVQNFTWDYNNRVLSISSDRGVDKLIFDAQWNIINRINSDGIEWDKAKKVIDYENSVNAIFK